MNVERTIFVRRGYLLTALAVAVLLAGFSGTAWAQSVSIRASSSTLPEDAGADDASTPDPVTVTITRSGTDRKSVPDTDPREYIEFFKIGAVDHLNIKAEYNGNPLTADNGGTSFALVPKGDLALVGGDLASGTKTLGFPNVDADSDKADKKIELTLSDMPDDGDWIPERLVLTVTPGANLERDDNPPHPQTDLHFETHVDARRRRPDAQTQIRQDRHPTGQWQHTDGEGRYGYRRPRYGSAS